jgi:hypothetical protein
MALAVAIAAAGVPAAAQQRGGSLAGTVTDETGAHVEAARVVVADASGTEVERTTGEDGRFVFRGLTAGSYSLKVTAEGFAEFATQPVEVGPSGTSTLDVTLAVAGVVENVTVTSTATGVTTEPDQNASAVVLGEKDLEALPDDPDQLAEALQELAGPGAGPGGGQFYVDGLSGGRLPPKSSIREVRINQNPFSAEFDRIGFGRIEILTKPGSDRFRGQVFGSFNDESLNARNAFALARPSEQYRRYGGNVSGPVTKSSSFFFDFERREDDEQNTVAATVLDPVTLVPTLFQLTSPEFDRRTAISPRFDLQAGEKHTLVFRYDFVRDGTDNNGVGDFSLPSRATNDSFRSHVLSVTDTFIISPTVVSETRFQFQRQSSTLEAISGDQPAINVLDAFYANSSAGLVTSDSNRWELQNYYNLALGNHTIKTGVRIRGIDLTTSSTSNFVGTFTFAGDVERDASGAPIPGSDPISSLEQYRRTLLGLPGYGASQFSIIYGDPVAGATQYDVGLFYQDDWRVRPNFTLSYGLRYENQTNAGDELNFAPRLGLAYSFGGDGSRPSTVLRAGFGVFYNRIDESLTLDADRYDGSSIRQYVVPNPRFFPNVPTEDQIAAFALPSSRQTLDALATPYDIQGSFSVERQLPWSLTGNVTYIFGRGVHQLRARNINAPVLETGLRPFGAAAGDIYSIEATGFSRRNQIRFGIQKRSAAFNLFANYGLNWSRSDTDGSGSFPVYSYDLSDEYGRASDDSRHFLFLGSFFQGPWGIRINPFIFARSGGPYNVTLGRDLNLDSRFTDRPSFASPDDVDAIATPFGLLDPTPEPGDLLIPRNLGTAPGTVRVNLSVSKTFGFGERSSTPEAGAGPGGPGGGPGGGRGGRGGGRGGFGHGGFGGDGGGDNSRYSLTVTLRAQNLLNQVNFRAPSGVLTSPIFGISNAALDGRRIEAQMRFSF